MKKCWVLSLIVIFVFGATFVCASFHPSTLGTSVSDSVAAGLHGGGCAKWKSSTCSAGACSSKTVIVANSSGNKSTPKGTKYCGGSSSCGNYWSYVQACCD